MRKCEGNVLPPGLKPFLKSDKGIQQSENGKKEGGGERERELQAEIKIMTGSPHQYTATPLCHP